jgi:glycosyltransferase involved in cell wall biosynthesis
VALRAAFSKLCRTEVAVKVLHVITVLGVGGTELQLRSVVLHSRHDCEVVTLLSLGSVADMLRADGVRVRNLGMRSNKQISALPRLWRLIRDGHYDVVHAHHYRSQVYARPAARMAGVPVVVSTEHSIGETHLDGLHRITPMVRALYLGSGMFSDMTIAVSGTVRDRLMKWGVPERKVTVIPNGIDLGRVAFDQAGGKQVRADFGIGADDYVMGVLGRLDSNKQVNLVIEAAAPLLRPDVTLLIVGNGDERARLEELARRCGVADRVVFAGERNDVGAVLSAMDLLVAASREETFGLSVVEALANGLPVLYTTSPALDGLTVRRARQVPGTVSGIRDAMATEVSVGRRARAPESAVTSEFSVQTVVARIDDLYERLGEQSSCQRGTALAAGAAGVHDRALDGMGSTVHGIKNVMAMAHWPGPIRDGRLDQRKSRHEDQDR